MMAGFINLLSSYEMLTKQGNIQVLISCYAVEYLLIFYEGSHAMAGSYRHKVMMSTCKLGHPKARGLQVHRHLIE
jgi:hypothetical protein